MTECKNCSCKASTNNQVVFIGDFICPWCYIGEVRLNKLAQTANVKIAWLPFELDRNTPVEGADRKEQRIKKFGSWEASLERDAKVREASDKDGIEFKHDLIKKTPNTFRAHRLMWFAEKEGKNTSELAHLIFKAYFSEGKDIGDVNTLIDLGSQVGLEKGRLSTFFQGVEGVSEVRNLEQAVRQKRIDYVPYVIIGNQTFSGSQSIGIYFNALENLQKTC